MATDVHDLDETRRLLYMALLARRTKKYNLAGTLVNSLKHHAGVDDDVDEIADKVIACIEGGDSISETGGTTVRDDDWIRQQIQRCTDELSG